MIKKFSAFGIYCFLFVSVLNAQDFIKLTITCLNNGENKMARIYAQSAWNKNPSKHTSYLLAYANFMLDNNDSAAFYSGIALFDGTIKQDVTFTDKQANQLKSILQYYKELNQQRSKDLVRALYEGYPRYSIIKARLTLSNRKNQTQKDILRLAALRNKEKALPTWEEYIDSLKKQNIPDSVISKLQTEKLIDETTSNYGNDPESVSQAFNEFYGINSSKSDEFIRIEWIDSSIYNTASSSFNKFDTDYLEVVANPYKQKKIYDSYYYPELYKKKAFLICPMIKIYMAYLKGSIDSTNYYVDRYKLNKKNLQSFYKKVFPSILDHKNSLAEFLKANQP